MTSVLIHWFARISIETYERIVKKSDNVILDTRTGQVQFAAVQCPPRLSLKPLLLATASELGGPWTPRYIS